MSAVALDEMRCDGGNCRSSCAVLFLPLLVSCFVLCTLSYLFPSTQAASSVLLNCNLVWTNWLHRSQINKEVAGASGQ